MEIEDKKFEATKIKAEDFYKQIDKIKCPYFNEDVSFNSKGIEHIKFLRKNHARPRNDQYIRLRLINLAPEIIKLSRTIQGISHTRNLETWRSNNKTEIVMKPVVYYEFVAILNDIRVRVIVKQVDGGPKYFWSIIPFWKVNKSNNQRRMFNGNPEID
ncbi:MAG: hypothetical protein HYT67_00825 [Candidatus Yanofskybacteria bacterium]|nr:hypothetical protein [Candidatus Yanofskybacteria bacterium]